MPHERRILLPPDRVDALLGELCTHLGYCLHPVAHLRIVNSPPRTVDRFTDVVIRADGDDPLFDHKLRQQVREVVQRYFAAAGIELSE